MLQEDIIDLEIRTVDSDLPTCITGDLVELATKVDKLTLSGCMFEAEDFNSAPEWHVETLVIKSHRSSANLDAFGCFSSITRLELHGVVSRPREGVGAVSTLLDGVQALQELVIVDSGVSGLECERLCHRMMDRQTLRSVHVAFGHADDATRVRCTWALSTLRLDFVRIEFEIDAGVVAERVAQNEE